MIIIIIIISRSYNWAKPAPRADDIVAYEIRLRLSVYQLSISVHSESLFHVLNCSHSALGIY